VPSSWIRQAGRWRWLKAATDWLPALLHHQEGLIQRGPGRGLRFNAANSAVGFLLGAHDADVQDALARLLRPGMVVYDVGANVGFTAVLAARLVTGAGQVVCFEPLPGNARQVAHNAALNGFGHVLVRQEALGKEDGEAAFTLSGSPTWGKLTAAGPAPGAAAGVTRVPVCRLDAVVAEAGLAAPDLIKMDVEGAEADVLAGAAQTLAAARPVLLVELHGTNRAVHDALVPLGYTTHILGSRAGILESRWDAQVLAVPAGRKGLGASSRR
jgi:FkbM family methyltransferase